MCRSQSRKHFQHGGSREDVEGHGAECQLRFARSALNPYSVALDVLPASSVLKTLLMSHLHGCRDERPGAITRRGNSSDRPGLLQRLIEIRDQIISSLQSDR